MADLPIDDLNVASNETLITPEQLKREIPLTEAARRTVAHGREVIRNILDGKDHRLFVVVGPCSIHDIKAAHEYAERLKALAAEVADSLFLVMRVGQQMIRNTYRGSRAIIRWRQGKGAVDIRGSIFCEVRDRAEQPLCEFYASAFRRLMYLFSLDAEVGSHLLGTAARLVFLARVQGGAVVADAAAP